MVHTQFSPSSLILIRDAYNVKSTTADDIGCAEDKREGPSYVPTYFRLSQTMWLQICQGICFNYSLLPPPGPPICLTVFLSHFNRPRFCPLPSLLTSLVPFNCLCQGRESGIQMMSRGRRREQDTDSHHPPSLVSIPPPHSPLALQPQVYPVH